MNRWFTMQVAIVTGGSSGIGRSAAVRIAARGIGVILTYHSGADRAVDTVRMIEKNGGTAVALPLDVGRTDTFPAFRQAVVAALRDTWDRDTADFLVNNGGLAQAAAFEDTTEEMFDRLTQVLLRGRTSSPRRCCRSSSTAAPSSTRQATRPCRTSRSPATPPTPR
jgi:NAD(P)-dependent dehydrogenase (short-subunit alcohol dehydrogenase family)